MHILHMCTVYMYRHTCTCTVHIIYNYIITRTQYIHHIYTGHTYLLNTGYAGTGLCNTIHCVYILAVLCPTLSIEWSNLSLLSVWVRISPLYTASICVCMYTMYTHDLLYTSYGVYVRKMIAYGHLSDAYISNTLHIVADYECMFLYVYTFTHMHVH